MKIEIIFNEIKITYVNREIHYVYELENSILELTLEQHRLELYRSTYTWISLSKYRCSST